MAEHTLKTWPEYFRAVSNGTKTFEVRKNDRGFQVGDTLRLVEWVPPATAEGEGRETGEYEIRRVSYLLSPDDGTASNGIRPGYVVLGLGPVQSEHTCNLFLCESEILVLKPEQLYLFSVDPKCERCRRIADVHER